jgi:sec-independent protein translocase protein TatA
MTNPSLEDSVCAREIDECELGEIPMGEGLLQPLHLLVIFGIALLVFGPEKRPERGKGLGEAIRGFKSSSIESEQAGKALGSATKK